MISELTEIIEAIPRNELATHWDVAVEFSILEGIMTSHLEDAEAGVVEKLLWLGDHVTEDVSLGYRLSYGDAGHQCAQILRCAQYDIVLMLKKRVADALIPAPMVFEKRVGQMRPLNPGDWLGEEARPWDDDDGASCGGCAVCRGGSVRPWCGRTGGSSIRGVCLNAAWRSGTS